MARSKSILPQGIRLHKSGKFIIDKTINGQRFTKTFDSLQDAVLFRMRLDTDKDFAKSITGNVDVKETVTLKTAIEYCQTHVWRELKSLMTHSVNARDIMSFFGADMKLDAIDHQAIDSLKEYLIAKGNKTGTINRKLMVLSNILSTARSRGMLETEPPRIKVKAQREGRIRVLSDDEERQLERLLTPECWELVKVLLYTGCRAGELWRLEARDIDQTLHTVTFWETKTGKSRTIPIVKQIRSILDHAISTHPSGVLFPGWNNMKLERAWAKAKTQMGLQDDEQFIPYCLRHTCASRLAAKNVSINLIKDWLGHSNINTTMRYTHFRKSDLMQIADMFE